MNKLWTYLDEKNWGAKTKYIWAILIICTLSALAGLLIWALIRPWALSTLDWMFCFIGYPALIAYVCTFLYACNHEFHEGSSY